MGLVMVMEVMVVMDMAEDMDTMERDLLMLSQDIMVVMVMEVMEVMDMAEDMVTMERDLLMLSQDMDMDMEEDMVMVVMDMEADTMVKKNRSNFLLKNCYQSIKTKYFSKF